MISTADIFFNRLKNRSVAFLGVGVTNTPLAELFIKNGSRVTVCDKRSREALGEAGDRLEGLGATLKLGDDYLKDLDAEVIFRTPGMRFHIPELEEYRRRGVVVTSEMEIFFELCPAHIIGITGSNGKTTTSTVISEMLKADGKRVWLGGNIGKALMPDLAEMTPDDWVVCELSSFQLISMTQSPDIAIVTNMTPNHLDMHKDMQEYIDSKKNIYLHQTAFDTAIFNADCPIVSGFIGEQRGRCLTFSRREAPFNGAWVDDDGQIWFYTNGEREPVIKASDIKIPGMHNVENYMTAICALHGIVSVDSMLKVAREFGGVEHRAEFVRCVDGVSYFNDSIATTPARTISGTLSLYDKKIIIIAGGYDKKIPFDDMGPAVCSKVSHLILLGATADLIEEAVRKCPDYEKSGVEIIRVADMDEAVKAARSAAKAGDIVSLSPACASFDMYPNYETRGRHFKELVNAL